MDLAAAVGQVIRMTRQNLILTQQDLAEIVGMHFTAVGRVERGEWQARLKTLDSVANGLGIPLSELIRQAEELRRLRVGGPAAHRAEGL